MWQAAIFVIIMLPSLHGVRLRVSQRVKERSQIPLTPPRFPLHFLSAFIILFHAPSCPPTPSLSHHTLAGNIANATISHRSLAVVLISLDLSRISPLDLHRHRRFLDQPPDRVHPSN